MSKKMYEMFAIKFKDLEAGRAAREHAREHYNPEGLILWQSLETFSNNDSKGHICGEYMIWESEEALEAGAALFTNAEYTQEYLGLIEDMQVGRWFAETSVSGSGVDEFHKL